MAGVSGLANPTGSPAWTRDAAIGDYGGDPEKRASSTEGDIPYAYQVYRELQAQRGSAYSKNTSATLVHVENLAIARQIAAIYFRHPEKLRANSQPAGADERLPYWVEVLGVPTSLSDQQWQIRQRCAAQYEAAVGPTRANVVNAITSLLGSALVDVRVIASTPLSEPPYLTYWFPINPGPSSYDMGGGAWASERCHLYVQVQQPPGMSDADYRRLLDVQLFSLLDRMLPCWATFSWGESDGFFLDTTQMDHGAFGDGESIVDAGVIAAGEGEFILVDGTGAIDVEPDTGIVDVGA